MENDWTKRIEELEAEVGRLMLMNPCNHTGFESAPCDICGYPDPRKLIARLKDERDADRRREYGYSQQTVDALTLERDKLTAERNDWKARYQSVAEMHDALIAEFNEMRAENKRLEAWIDDLQSEMYINCVYCGHRYGPNKGDHLVTMRKTLEKHIEECPKHPLSMARNRIMELEAENRWLRDQYNSLIFEVSYKFPGESRHDTAKRYIREREEYGIGIVAKQALKEASHEGAIQRSPVE